MEQSSSQGTGSRPASYEISCILWNRKVHYRIQAATEVDTEDP